MDLRAGLASRSLSARRMWRAVLILHLTVAVLGGAACCEKKAKALAAAKQRFIVHPEDAAAKAPLVPDLTARAPDGWDVEEDGEWLSPMIADPTWRKPTPRLIRNPDYAESTTLAVALLDEIAGVLPWMLVGAFVTAAFKVAGRAVPVQLLARPGPTFMARLMSVTKGALLGLVTPLCSCGVLPIAKGLAGAGASLPALVAFVTATQSAGIDSAAITWGLLGPVAALYRLLGASLLAIAAGSACSFLEPQREPQQHDPAPEHKAAPEMNTGLRAASSGAGHAMVRAALLPLRLVMAAADAMLEVVPAVVAGLAISTMMLRQLPALQMMLDHFVGSGIDAAESNHGAGSWTPVLTRLLVLGSVLPLQLCEHASAALAAGVQKSGGSPGLAFAFLLSAPATSLATLLMIVDTSRRCRMAVGVTQPRRPAGSKARCCDGSAEECDAATSGRGTTAAAVALAALVAAALVMTSLLLSFAVDAMGLNLLAEHGADATGSVVSLAWLEPGVAKLATLVLLSVALLRRVTDACNRSAAMHSAAAKQKSE